MKPEGREQTMASTSPESTVDIAALPDDMFTVVLHGDDVTGELFAAADRDAIGADAVALASAQSTIFGRDELMRLRGRIGELLGEALGIEALEDPFVGGLVEDLKRAVTRHAGASDDEAHTLNALVEVAAERARQRDTLGDSQLTTVQVEPSPPGRYSWNNLHYDRCIGVVESPPKQRRTQIVRAAAAYVAEAEAISREASDDDTV